MHGLPSVMLDTQAEWARVLEDRRYIVRSFFKVAFSVCTSFGVLGAG